MLENYRNILDVVKKNNSLIFAIYKYVLQCNIK